MDRKNISYKDVPTTSNNFSRSVKKKGDIDPHPETESFAQIYYKRTKFDDGTSHL